MEATMIIVGVVVGAIAGGVIAFFGARARAKAIVAKAEADGEMIKKEKIYLFLLISKFYFDFSTLYQRCK